MDIQRFLNSRSVGLRRQLNLRNTIISLFRWAKRMSFLDPDRVTEAEKVEQIKKVPGKPNVLSPAQMLTLLGNVRQDYVPWLCVAAFAGVRTEEIAPDRQSKKSPLQWEDFDWDHKVIIIREETSKVGDEREVPISDNLAAWLAPYRNATGPICTFQPTNNETGRVGKTIGGWKHNCLRDSFCSYRTRITQNIHQTSLEMGNSPQMIKRSYHKRQSIQEAQEWFGIMPPSNVVAFTEAA
jgi:integrase